MNGFDSPRLRSSLPAVDIDGFLECVGDAIKAELDNSKVPEDKRPLYTEDWPKERLKNAKPENPFDFIGHHVVFSRRASTSNKGYRAAKGLGMPIGQEPSPDKEGYTLYTFRQLEEGIVQFTIFASSNRRAKDLMRWFKNLLSSYHDLYGFFRARGVDHLVFHRRLEDTIEKVENQDLYTRRLQYVVRVQNLVTLEAKTADTLQINVGSSQDSEIDSFTVNLPELA